MFSGRADRPGCPRRVTADWLRAAGAAAVEIEPWQSDAGATVLAHHRFDASALELQAAPHTANVAAVSRDAGTRIDWAYTAPAPVRKSKTRAWQRWSCRQARRATCASWALRRRTRRAPQRNNAADHRCGRSTARELLRFAPVTAAIGWERTKSPSLPRRATSRGGWVPPPQVYLASPYTVAASATPAASATQGFLNEQRALWVFGDNLDTDVLAPAIHETSIGSRALPESVDPAFAGSVKAGDVVVMAQFRHRFLARTAAGTEAIRRRWSLNHRRSVLPQCTQPGLACVGAEAAHTRLRRVRVDPEAGRIENLSAGETLACDPIPAHLMQMLRDGGLVPHLEKRLRGENSR